MGSAFKSYVVLQYIPGSEDWSRGAINILVLEEQDGVSVHLHPGYEEEISAGDGGSLSDLLAEWREVSGQAEAESLLREISELSAGSLRATASGVLHEGARGRLMAEVLG